MKKDINKIFLELDENNKQSLKLKEEYKKLFNKLNVKEQLNYIHKDDKWKKD